MLLLGLGEIGERILEISAFFSFVNLLKNDLPEAILLVYTLLNYKDILCLKVLFLLAASLFQPDLFVKRKFHAVKPNSVI